MQKQDVRTSQPGWPPVPLRCPRCRERALGLETVRSYAGPRKPWSGTLACSGCGEQIALERGVARIVDDEDYVDTFGWQWRAFDVVRPEEDLRVFCAKVGTNPSMLRGMSVLDAGCGGGRYSRLVAEHGACVTGVDRSRAVDAAAALCRRFSNACFVQADLLELPFADESFDFVFSIGVIHHCPQPQRAFRELARVVRAGGTLALWVYRRNTWLQERLNWLARSWTTRLTREQLEAFCRFLAVLGAIPALRVTLNKLLNFSNHPDPVLRVCDNYDWYACRYQFHHTEDEVRGWFEAAGFTDVRFLPPLKQGTLYRWAYRRNLIIGSGVNVVGRKP